MYSKLHLENRIAEVSTHETSKRLGTTGSVTTANTTVTSADGAVASGILTINVCRVKNMAENSLLFLQSSEQLRLI